MLQATKGVIPSFVFGHDVWLPRRVKLHLHTTKDSMDLLWASSWITLTFLWYCAVIVPFYLIWQQQWLIVGTPKQPKCMFSWEASPCSHTNNVWSVSYKSGLWRDFILLQVLGGKFGWIVRCDFNSGRPRRSLFELNHVPLHNESLLKDGRSENAYMHWFCDSHRVTPWWHLFCHLGRNSCRNSVQFIISVAI